MSKLQDLQGQLQSELDAQIAELNKAIEATETTTRRILSAEIEIARHQQSAAGLEADAERLQKEQGSLRKRAEDVRTSHGKQVEERDLLRLELEGLQEEQTELTGEVDTLRKSVKKAEALNEKLTSERDSLSSKLGALEENIAMMKQLKSDLMASIKENMNELAGSE
jgi:chromosome segregation ATPase